MRGILLAILGGCGFNLAPGGVGAIDAPRTGDGAPDASSDGAPDASSDAPVDGTTDAAVDAPMMIDAPVVGTCGGKIWFTDFSADPTTFDNNGDSINDFAMRDDSVFPPAQLISGEWSTPDASPNPLDTRPAQAFATRTIVDVRMRSTTTSGAKGAVFWINFGYNGTTHVALFVDIKRLSATEQRMQMVNKVNGIESVVATLTNLPIGPIDIHLDVDPGTPRVTYTVDGNTGSQNLARENATALSWATLTAYSGAAAFDRLRVEVCP